MWNSTQNRSKSDLNKKQNKVKQNQNVTNESAGRLYWVKKSLYACTLVISVTNSFLLMIFVRRSPICHEVITRSHMVAQVQFLVNGCVWMTTILLAPVILAVSCCFPVVCKIPRSCHSRDSQHSNSYPRNRQSVFFFVCFWPESNDEISSTSLHLNMKHPPQEILTK